MQETFNLLVRLAGEGSSLETVHEGTLHALGVVELLHENSILLHTRDVEGLHLSTNAIDEVVVLDRRGARRSSDLGVVCRTY